MDNFVILGCGVTGCGAADRLHKEGVRATIYDKNPYLGGHTASFRLENGFTFDDGPHVSFTQNERVQKVFADAVGGAYETIQVQVNNYWQGSWIRHPAQVHLHGLPDDLVIQIIKEFAELPHQPEREIRNYADWLLASYGPTFAKTFPMEYTKKYHTAAAEQMSTDWLGPRLYVPDLEEVLRGALSPKPADVHYVTHFRYPSHGGFVSYLEPHFSKAEIELNHLVTRIVPQSRERTGTVEFSNGKKVPYDHLITALPLPVLIPLIEGAPADVREAADTLACTSCVTVNIGVGREDISEYHWTYFYDEEFSFARISFPHMQSPNNVPTGCSSIQVEVYFSKKYRPFDGHPDDCIAPVLADLRRCGVLREDDEIVYSEARFSEYANVIFDLDREPALKTINGYLDDLGIRTGGRYGEWGYHWTDESFVSGENAAQKALDSQP